MSPWTSSEFDQHEQICFFHDAQTGLKAVVAIHSTARGPAAGGTRFKAYANDDLAIDDALRLSRAMSYKCAMAGLPTGGGKAVIIGAPEKMKTRELLHAYGHFLNRIGSTFATGEDVGMTVADMDIINEVTPFVGGTSKGSGDPSVPTADGVVHGLRAVLRHRFGRSDFQGVKLAIQGLGAVGWGVAERTFAEGAVLTVADIRTDQTARASKAFGATVMNTEDIHTAEVDIFVPCALGGILTEETANQISARAVAGAANNQLASPEAGAVLHARQILFAPDYVMNAGGIISGISQSVRLPGREALTPEPLAIQVARIEERLTEIFQRSERDHEPPEVTTLKIAQELIGR